MKKYIILFTSILTLGIATPVSAQSDNNETRIAEIESQIKELTAELKELRGLSDEKIIFADDEFFYIEFKELKEDESDYFGTVHEFVFEVHNKTDMNIEIQARSVSIDDFMLDDLMYSLSQNIAPGKKANAIFTVKDLLGDGEMPDMVGNLEMEFHIFNWDDFSESVDYPILINLD